jgi:hypothetical protein
MLENQEAEAAAEVVSCPLAGSAERWNDRPMPLIARDKFRPIEVVDRRADNVRFEARTPDFGVFVRCLQYRSLSRGPLL